MTRFVPLRIAGIDLGLELPEVLAAWAERRWHPFLCEGEAEPVIAVSRGRLGPPSESNAQRPLPKVFTEGRDTVVNGEGWSGRRGGEATAWTIEDEVNEAGLSLMVQLALADAVTARGGLLLHSVGIAVDAGAAVFSGQSGAGKSTLAQHAEAGGARLLADELVALLPQSGGFWAHGTPWNRGSRDSSPLGCIGLLGWGSPHRFEDVAAGEVLRTLLPNALILDTGPSARQTLFERAGDLLRRVPRARLIFSPHASVAEAVRQRLEAGW